jgi:PrcB C-terminal
MLPVIARSSAFALFVLLGARATGGCRVGIEQVALTGNDLRVCALEVTPPAEAATTQALTAPYQMATVPKFDGTAELSMRSETRW